MTTEIALEVRRVKKYFGEVRAVDDVSLEIREGEIFSLLGPSGCGKTTLLRLVAGLEEVDAGEIFIGGQLVNAVPPYRRDCSIVFQQHALFPHMTVADNIGFGLVERRLPKKEIRRLVGEILEVVNMTGLENRRPHQLSGGQQQRVALARSLVLRPKVLLLDEPLTALDRKLRIEMQTELRRIQREVGITFLHVTHDQKAALSLSDRIAVMREGKVVQMGSPTEIYETPKTVFVADFMGATNIFTGRVVSHNETKLELETDDGYHLTAAAAPGEAAADIVGISVHPEVIEVLPRAAAVAAGENVLAGRLQEVFYQGESSELTVVLEGSGRQLTIHLGRRAEGEVRLSPGEPVLVRWQRRHSNVLRGDAAAGIDT